MNFVSPMRAKMERFAKQSEKITQSLIIGYKGEKIMKIVSQLIARKKIVNLAIQSQKNVTKFVKCVEKNLESSSSGCI